MGEHEGEVPLLRSDEPLTEEEAYELSEMLLRRLARTGEQEHIEPTEGSVGD
jgi:hypothetical protein